MPVKTVKYHKHKHKKSKWITQGIMKSIKYRDRLYADLQMTDRNDASYIGKKTNLTTYNRMLKQNIRLAKKQYYNSCFQKFRDDVKKTWSSINEIMNRTKKKKDFPKQFLVNDHYITDPRRIANEFNKFFISIGSTLSDSIQQPQNRSFEEFLRTPLPPCFKFGLIDKKIVLNVIDRMKPKSSSGFDGLSNKLLKCIKYELVDCITIIINQSFTTNIFPDQLKLAKVIPLYKKNEDYLFDNYRPISLLPSISKVIERIMHFQIIEYFHEHNLMYNSQYGFRQNHSTELATLEIIDKIAYQMDRNEIPLNIFLDLSKAFDCLNHEILLHKLEYYGFCESSCLLMKSYLSNRKQFVNFGDTESDYLEVKIGVPQGSILGPLLFLIYVNDLVHATSSFRPVIYADDTTLGACISYFGNQQSIIEENINNELLNVHAWLNLNRLSLNVQKTKAMIFHTNRRHVIPPNIRIQQQNIEYVDSFNYLGIILDKHLSWNSHINMVSKKISQLSGIMNKLKNFLPKPTLLTLYNSLALPHLNYGILLWGCKAVKLEKLQKRLIRTINCAKYNAHSEPLFKSMSLLKIVDIRVLHELAFCYKLLNNKLPNYFENNVFTRNFDTHTYSTRGANKFQMPRIKHSFMKNVLRYRIPFTYNNVKKEIVTKMSSHCFSGFKKYVKQDMISQYALTCSINNCYICQTDI